MTKEVLSISFEPSHEESLRGTLDMLNRHAQSFLEMKDVPIARQSLASGTEGVGRVPSCKKKSALLEVGER